MDYKYFHYKGKIRKYWTLLQNDMKEFRNHNHNRIYPLVRTRELLTLHHDLLCLRSSIEALLNFINYMIDCTDELLKTRKYVSKKSSRPQ